MTSAEQHIGLRKGLIPIYLSVVLHEYKKEIVICDRYGQITMNADAIEQINAEPGLFTLSYIDWNPEKEEYIAALEEAFSEYAIEDRTTAPYEYVMIAMKRWYMELPKYAKNAKCVYQYMDKFYRECGGNAGRGNYEQAKSAGELIANTRSMIQDLLHCPTKQVVFEPTATIALNLIIQGNIERGAHNIYVSPFEHNAVTRVLHHFEKQEKIVVRQLTVGENLRYDMERIRYQFEEEKPDFVIVSHASNSFGVVALLEDIFALAKKYGARTLADMSQTAGLIDTNVGLETFDYAVFAGHKTLYGPTGISGFVMNPEADFPAVLFGGTGFESANQDMPESLPQKYEAGTLNIAGVAGLYAAIKWINETGLGIIWEKEQEHRAKLMEILSGYDFIHVVGADKDVPYVGIVSCLIDGISSDSAGNIFDEQGISVRTGLECAPLAHQFMNTYPAGTIRFSVSYFTSDKDFNTNVEERMQRCERYRCSIFEEH